MIYCFDLDGTICKTPEKNYEQSTADAEMVKLINELFDLGHIIKIYTARGMTRFSGNVEMVYEQYFDLTKNQLESWGLKYHELILGKPSYDFFIDDKNLSIQDFKKETCRGVLAGCFDVIHPGYIHAFEEAKKSCTHLTVLLHDDPSFERSSKAKPVLPLSERKKILESISYVDKVESYSTEAELSELLSKGHYHVRFLGDDYVQKDHTGKDLPIKIQYIDRNHGWSSTKFKNKIAESIWKK
jgi:glycerol-3-phosphate cytidylyltransferase